MSSKKNLAPYLSIMFAGVIGFQSLAIGQVAVEPRQVNPKQVVNVDEQASFAAKAKVKGRQILDPAKLMEYASLAADMSDNQDMVTQATHVRDALKAIRTGLDNVSREPYHNPKYSARANEWFNRLAFYQVFLNQAAQLLAGMQFTGPRADATLLAIPMLTGTAIRYFATADTIVSPEAIQQQLLRSMDEMGLDQSVKEQIDSEIVKVREATKELIGSRSVLNKYVLQYGYNLSDNGSLLTIPNLVTLGAVVHALLEIFFKEWKPAMALAHTLEDAGRVLGVAGQNANEVAAAAKQIEAVGTTVAAEANVVAKELAPLAERFKSMVGMQAAKAGQKGLLTRGTGAVGTNNALDSSAYAFASTSTETLESVQKLNATIGSSILRIDAQIKMMAAQGK